MDSSLAMPVGEPSTSSASRSASKAAEVAPPSPGRQSSFRPFEDLSEQPLEEESFSSYDPAQTYPVQISQVFQSGQYQVVAKIGFGSVTTSWLCRDLKNHEYVSLKVYTSNASYQAEREVNVHNHLNSIHSKHSGKETVCTPLDSFSILGKNGTHLCIIHSPPGMSAFELTCLLRDITPIQPVVKKIISQLLGALDFLHSEAGVIHTDIQPYNLRMTLDDSYWAAVEAAEHTNPSPRKNYFNRTIYASRAMEIPDDEYTWMLYDFSKAAFGQEKYSRDTMPDLYRAPEIMLGLRWDEKIDIWAVGLLAYQLMEGSPFFEDHLPNRAGSALKHLYRMIEFLGPPPREMCHEGLAEMYFNSGWFDKDGKYTSPSYIEGWELREVIASVEGEEKEKFINFLERCIQWRPKDRATAKELLQHPWIQDIFAKDKDTAADPVGFQGKSDNEKSRKHNISSSSWVDDHASSKLDTPSQPLLATGTTRASQSSKTDFAQEQSEGEKQQPESSQMSQKYDVTVKGTPPKKTWFVLRGGRFRD